MDKDYKVDNNISITKCDQSNPDENYLLRQEEYQNKLITLIADAIEKYYQK